MINLRKALGLAKWKLRGWLLLASARARGNIKKIIKICEKNEILSYSLGAVFILLGGYFIGVLFFAFLLGFLTALLLVKVSE